MIASRRRLVLPLAVLALASAAAPALAADGGDGSTLLSATLTAGSIGSRSVTTVTALPLSTALNSELATTDLSVVVTEAARAGTNGWTVTTSSADLVLTGDATKTIDNANLSVLSRTVTPLNGGGTSVAPEGSQTLDAERLLITNTGQNAQALYTGTYTSGSSIALTVPNGQVTGTYTGTLTVTLTQ